MTQAKPPAGAAGKCPICSRPTVQAYRPFCSRRCADVDLSRWLGGAYAIPVADDDDDEDGASAADAVRKTDPGPTH
jgi:endogenous inhibitor of DNA gyrase (YacG/DUF329 family)